MTDAERDDAAAAAVARAIRRAWPARSVEKFAAGWSRLFLVALRASPEDRAAVIAALRDDEAPVGGYDVRMNARFDAIGLVVADMARSLAFYRRLGLDIPAGADGEEHVEATMPGGLRLMWDTEESVRAFDPGWTAPTGSPRIGLAFACTDAAEVDAVYAELTAAGFAGQREPWDAVWGQRYATLGDPDGNAVVLFAWLPGRQPQG